MWPGELDLAPDAMYAAIKGHSERTVPFQNENRPSLPVRQLVGIIAAGTSHDGAPLC
jgi:hypothetical protein